MYDYDVVITLSPYGKLTAVEDGSPIVETYLRSGNGGDRGMRGDEYASVELPTEYDAVLCWDGSATTPNPVATAWAGRPVTGAAVIVRLDEGRTSGLAQEVAVRLATRWIRTAREEE